MYGGKLGTHHIFPILFIEHLGKTINLWLQLWLLLNLSIRTSRDVGPSLGASKLSV